MRRLVALSAIVVATLPVPGATAAAVPVLVVDGRGYGHGVGMAQDGAYWMGVDGARTEEILGHFYPGTSLGRGSGAVRVVVGEPGGPPASVVLAFPDGGEVRDARGGEQSPGFPVKVPPGGAVRVVAEAGRYRVEGPAGAGTVAIGRPALASATRPRIDIGLDPPTTTAPTTTTTAQPPLTTTTTTAPSAPAPTSPPATEPPPPQPAGPPAPTTARPVWAVAAGGGTVELTSRQRRYRGMLEVSAAGGPLRVVNEVDVETYLKGMGEVRDPSWPPAALRAQAIAARTYALRAMVAGGGELCDTQRCQVYLGAQAEYAAMNRAVDDSRGQVLAYRGQLASAVYSANGGGHSASREEGFGVADDGAAPYLRPAPYPTRDVHTWNVAIALDTVAARVGYPGTLTSVHVSRAGPSGRALEVTLDGPAGPRIVPGVVFDAALGLKSTLFTLRVDAADVAPPAPPPEALLQLPPAELDAGPAEGPQRASRSRDRGLAARVGGDSTTRSGDGADEMAMVFASWAVFAAAGAALLTAGRRGQWVRLYSSNSASDIVDSCSSGSGDVASSSGKS
ncbi:MAG TPA: SpoIID/LytB domain-containing protein [Acidimicrobiales bacterium]|nr:SpoIID/LytB domain-containing protein [Acidimicrobiales bacterium]